MQNSINAVMNRFLKRVLRKNDAVKYVYLCVFWLVFLEKIVHLFTRLERVERNGRFQPIVCIALEVRIVHLERKCMSAPLVQKELNARKIACRNLRVIFIRHTCF